MRVHEQAATRGATILATLLLAVLPALAASKAILPPSERAAALDGQIDWSRARLIAVQDAGRYKTLDSFARESMSAMYGREHLPGLSPLASLMEWVFNREAYNDEPVVRIKDKGLRIHFSTHMPGPQREYIVLHGYMTPRQLQDTVVQSRMRELEPRFEMVTAMRRVRDSQAVAGFMSEMLFVVPPATPDPKEPWHLVKDLVANLPEELRSLAGNAAEARQAPVAGVSAEQAVAVLGAWASLRAGWLAGDASGVQTHIDRLAGLLPQLAAPGIYPRESQRAAEARYYAMGKFTGGWMIYFVAAIAAAWALITRWTTPWVVALALLGLALGWHAYGISLRWYILGRIPVANMFEAVVASAWAGIALAFVAEVFLRTRVFAFGGAVTGFVALMLASYVIPGGGTLTTIMGILDDVMLRIHTVLIISSYAMIFVAAVIAAVYLFGYYVHTSPLWSLQSGIATSLVGGIVWAGAGLLFQDGGVTGPIKIAHAASIFWAGAAAALTMIGVLVWRRAHGGVIFAAALLCTALVTLAIGNHDFIRGTGATLAMAGLAWAIATGLAMLPIGAAAADDVAQRPALAGAGAAGVPGVSYAAALQISRPVMAGGAPGDEVQGAKLPHWLHTVDWSHLIILNLVFVLLFVGTILGAVWADYSWGRPWGWDPKEVFALNTWLVYAVLIHVRFVVRDRGLWTAWLSLAGCAMMAFNWCFVNFFIVGLHSYA